jgi:phospholipid/cholesterol/gamma-HCH transport system substrate-binding protein
MSRVIREHLRDFLAIIALVVAGVVTAFVILANQSTALPSWVPLLGEERFELKAQFTSAQAVTPGQGQSVVIAGIKVGDITKAELENGQAIVTMEVDYDKSDLIKEDASLLLRPKTGLNDMVIEVDPGSEDEESVEEGSTIPLASTQPNVNPDEVLASLDADTQAFLKLLLAGGAEALDPEQGRDRKLSNTLRELEPFARNIARLSGGLEVRRRSISRSIHNFRLLSEELGNKDAELTAFVDSSNAVLQSFANQEASIREALRELPSTLQQTDAALVSSNKLALASLPALRDSLPGARALAPSLRKLRPFLTQTVAPIRDQIRPFTVNNFLATKHLRQSLDGLAKTTPSLKNGLTRLNELLNALAYDAAGSTPSYLYYLTWMNHNLNSAFTLQDAHGPLRRGVVLETCNTSLLADNVFNTSIYLKMLAELTILPTTPEIC